MERISVGVKCAGRPMYGEDIDIEQLEFSMVAHCGVSLLRFRDSLIRARLCGHFSIEKTWKVEKLFLIFKITYFVRSVFLKESQKNDPTFSTNLWKIIFKGGKSEKIYHKKWKLFSWNWFSAGTHKCSLSQWLMPRQSELNIYALRIYANLWL